MNISKQLQVVECAISNGPEVLSFNLTWRFSEPSTLHWNRHLELPFFINRNLQSMPVDRKQPNSTSSSSAFWTWVERALKASCPAERMEHEPRKESPFIGYNMCSPRAKCNLHATCLSQAVIYEMEKLQAVRLDCPESSE